MHIALAVAFFFAVLTLWVPAVWPVTVFQLSVFALGMVTLRGWARRFPGFTYPMAPLGFAVVWGLLQWIAGLTVYPFETKTAIVLWTTLLTVFLVGYTVFGDPGRLRWFRAAMLWFGFLVAILATVQSFTSEGKVFWLFPVKALDHVMGPVLSRNHYAAFVEVVLPFALYEALRRERNSLLYAAMAAVLYASVVASASRAGTVLATAEVIAVTGILWKTGKTSGRAAGLSLVRIAVCFAAFTAVVGWQAVWDRFWVPDPYAGRREFALSSLEMIAERPWTGFGLGTWPTAYPAFARIDPGALVNRAHCDWLEWTAEGGLPLGIALASLLVWAARPALGSVWGLGVLAVFLHAAVDYPFSRPALASWCMVVLAMLAARERAPKAPGDDS